MMSDLEILKRLYKGYTRKFLKQILLSVFFSALIAASTSAIAWLLDPAIKKIFIDKDQTLIFVIPLLIIIAFTTKGVSLYIAKVIMINVSQELKAGVQKDMIKSLISSPVKVSYSSNVCASK